MNNLEALKKCVDVVGLKPLALHLGVSYQAVQKYLDAGQVTSERVLKCSEATGWSITPHQLRPDLYPHPHDGLPEHIRSAA